MCSESFAAYIQTGIYYLHLSLGILISLFSLYDDRLFAILGSHFTVDFFF